MITFEEAFDFIPDGYRLLMNELPIYTGKTKIYYIEKDRGYFITDEQSLDGENVTLRSHLDSIEKLFSKEGLIKVLFSSYLVKKG